MQEKMYIGNLVAKQGKYGNYLSGAIKIDQLRDWLDKVPDLIQQGQKNRYVCVDVGEMRDLNDNGERQFTVKLWLPKKKTNQPVKQPVQPQVNHQDFQPSFNESDVPF